MNRMKWQLGLCLLAVVCLMGSSQATVIFSEDFTGTTGADLTTKGWTQTGGQILISDTTIDVGQSGVSGSNNGSADTYTKSIGHTLSAGEWYEITYTALRTGAGSREVYIPIYESAGSSGSRFFFNWFDNNLRFNHTNAAGTLGIEHWNTSFGSHDGGIDVKIVTGAVGTSDDVRFFWRDHGQTAWTEAPVTYQGWAGGSTAGLDSIMLYLKSDSAENPSYVDSIVIDAVPEPATMSLLVGGGLCVLLRKRR